MARRYRQSRSDMRDERRGMKKYYDDYPSKESRAGHRYDESKKHHMAESRGMKRYESSHGGGHAHKEKHVERRHNMPMHYGSSNHGDGSYGGPMTARMLAQEVAQRIEHWGDQAGGPIRQHENGSMDYLDDKGEIWREDDRRISKDMLPQ